MRVRLNENVPKADSRNANPVHAMVEVVEPVCARISGEFGAVVSLAGSVSVTCVGSCACSGLGTDS